MSRWKPKNTLSEEEIVTCPHCGEEDHDLTEDLMDVDDPESEEREVQCPHCGTDYTIRIVITRTFTMEVV